MYHAVGTGVPDDTQGIYTVAPNQFQDQVSFLARQGMYPLAGFEQSARLRQGVSVTFDDGYRDTLIRAAPVLVQNQVPFTVFVTRDYVRSGNPLYLSETELRELADLPGVTIGSHGCSHAKLRQCNDEQLKHELRDSKSYLEDVIQCLVTTISYPHGSVDARVRDAAVESGYTLGTCSLFGCNDDATDLMLLNRTDIWSTDRMSDFRSKLAGNWDWIESVR
jgi:peptidoglycan/xylan/chitin deacetylase (PgdA/CDA1 family)